MSERRRWIETGDEEADALADARRAQIVESTWRLIATIGLEQTTMRRIAQDVGCTTGLVTHYFASKDEVLLAALQRITDVSAERMRAGDGLVGRARLHHLADAILPLDEQRTLEWRVWLAFWGRAYSNPVLLEEQQARYHRWRHAIERGIEEAVDRGELARELDVEAELAHLVGLLMGLSIDAINRGTAGAADGLLLIVDRHLARLVGH